MDRAVARGVKIVDPSSTAYRVMRMALKSHKVCGIRLFRRFAASVTCTDAKRADISNLKLTSLAQSNK